MKRLLSKWLGITAMKKDHKVRVGKRLLAFLLAFAMIMQPVMSSVGMMSYAEESASEEVTESSDSQDNTAAQKSGSDQVQSAEPDASQAESAASDQNDQPAARSDAQQKDAADQKSSDDTAEKKESDDEEEDTFPAQSFKDSVTGLVVNVSAPEGALPENATMKVKAVDLDKVIKAAEKIIDGDIKKVRAADITFYDKDGKEIEPVRPVSVSMTASGMEAGTEKTVVHIDDNWRAEEIGSASVSNKGVARFKADEFSIYAVVEENGEDEDAYARVKVVFARPDGTEIASAYVKEADVKEGAISSDILHDPGAGTLPSGVTFKGWTTDKTYTTNTVSKTIDDVRSEVASVDWDSIRDGEEQDGTVLTYYAMLFRHYSVTYLDEAGISLGRVNVEFRADSTETQQAYTVNMQYASPDETHHFEGWNVADGDDHIVGHQAGTMYTNETDITITGDVVFSVNAPEGHWFVFNENGNKATYNAPQFLEADEKPVRPADSSMQRNGYTFGGWYATKAIADDLNSAAPQYNFNQTITTRTEVFARWIPKTTAPYAIIIWKQNITGDGYDFAGSISKTGNVGNTINDVQQRGSGDDAYARIDGTNYQYTGFHLDHYDQDVTIRTEGNSVVNVYYDRTEYTLTFKSSNSGTPQYKQNSGYQLMRVNNYGYEYAIQINGKWYQITGNNASHVWDNNRTIRPDSNIVPGGYVRMTRQNNNNYYEASISSTEYAVPGVYKTITALYGQSIGDNFPITDNGASAEWRWKPQNSDTFSNVLVYIDVMPGENVTFYPNQAQSGTANRYMEFYVEALPGQTPDRTWNGKSFVKYGNTITAKYNWFTEDEDFAELAGYEQYGSDPAFNNGRADVEGGGTIYFYYTRKAYDITFMDGKYVDGNDNPKTEDSMGELGSVEDINYGEDVSSYNYDPQTGQGYKPQNTPGGYVFEGWFLDDACTHPYTFTTMPENGITVYAKWRLIEYRVFLHPNAGTDTTLDWGSATQAMNFRGAYGTKISAPDGKRTGYTFVGWYTHPDLTGVFNAEAFVLNESTVTENYDKTTHFTDPMDKWGNGATTNADTQRFWITKEYNLYAKWRQDIEGAEGIGVSYDLNGGSGSASDTNLYVDNATATAVPAVKAPAGKKFLYWVPQKWNGTAYVDIPNSKVYPGKDFTVLLANAKKEPNGYKKDSEGHYIDSEGNVTTDPDKYVPLYKYTVQLRAEYADMESPVATHIYWFWNDGSAAFRKDTINTGQTYQDSTLAINESVSIEAAPEFTHKTGYKFAGWARVNIGLTVDALDSFYNTDSNWTQNDPTKFLYYAGGAFHLGSDTGTVVTRIAADEETPYQAMFAVWEPIQYTVKFDKNAEDAIGTMDDQIFEYDEEKELTANAFTRENSVFKGWNTEPDGSGTSYTDEQLVKNLTETNGDEITLYAQWAKCEYTIHHYLKGTTTKVAEDVTGEVAPGTQITATPVTTYQQRDLTVDSYNPSQTITVTEDGTNVITIYYTLPLKITAETKNKVYDGDPLNGVYQVEGILPDDVQTVNDALGTPPSITNVSESPKNYLTEDEQAAITGIPSYYDVTYTPGKLTITKKAVTITVTPQTYTYNGKAQGEDNKTYTEGLSDKVTVDGLATGDALTSIKLNGQETNVGEYDGKIVASAAEIGEVTGNYDITYVAGKLTITKKAVTITVTDAEKIYDTDDPEFTGTVKGLVEDDDLGTITYSRTNEDEDVGVYEKVLTASYTENNNYAVTVKNGDFTIKPATMTVTVKDYNGTYDGKNHQADVTVDITDGTIIEYSTDGGETWSDEVPSIKNVGTVDYMVRATNPNYETVEASGTLKVAPKSVTVTADDLSKVAGTSDPDLTATVKGLIGDDTISYTIRREAGSTPGTYRITVTGDSEQGNYSITFVAGTFTIEPAPTPTPTPEPPSPAPRRTTVNRPATITLTPPTVNTDDGTQTITDDPTPQATIKDNKTPKAEPEEAEWALINLLCAAATVLISVLLLVFYFVRKREDEEDDDTNGKLGMRLCGLIPAIAAVVAFILTEDMSANMQMVDKWTIMMAVILAIEAVLAVFSRKSAEE